MRTGAGLDKQEGRNGLHSLFPSVSWFQIVLRTIMKLTVMVLMMKNTAMHWHDMLESRISSLCQ